MTNTEKVPTSFELLAREAKARKLVAVLLNEFANQLERGGYARNALLWASATRLANVNPPSDESKKLVCQMIREAAEKGRG